VACLEQLESFFFKNNRNGLEKFWTITESCAVETHTKKKQKKNYILFSNICFLCDSLIEVKLEKTFFTHTFGWTKIEKNNLLWIVTNKMGSKKMPMYIKISNFALNQKILEGKKSGVGLKKTYFCYCWKIWQRFASGKITAVWFDEYKLALG